MTIKIKAQKKTIAVYEVYTRLHLKNTFKYVVITRTLNTDYFHLCMPAPSQNVDQFEIIFAIGHNRLLIII